MSFNNQVTLHVCLSPAWGWSGEWGEHHTPPKFIFYVLLAIFSLIKLYLLHR